MKGRIEFECSDPILTQGFAWAKQQALAYSHEQDPVGDWYEAALPGREAFCMRDVSHQARGAHILGLEHHTKNMLRRFVQSISESRDFCCYWEINRENLPAPADYLSDEDFWYNLPANFDLLDACYHMYCLTGDEDYIHDPDFCRFYDLSMHEYIRCWDSNGDGIPERKAGIWRRGIPSYNETDNVSAVQMLDMLSAEQRGYRSYARIKQLQGNLQAAEQADAAADALRREIDCWWDAEQDRLYFLKLSDGSFDHLATATCEEPLYFGAIQDEIKTRKTLNQLHDKGLSGIQVEILSHMAEIFYRYGEPERGEYWLRQMIDPQLHRREYPELSFAVVADMICDMVGISYDLPSKSITVTPNLPASISTAAVRNLPVYGREADVFLENGSVRIDYRN